MAGEPMQESASFAPAAYFDAVQQAFARAQGAFCEPVVNFFRIANHTIRLCFAGPALTPSIRPALEHLATEPVADPALSICLWDRATTGVSAPRPPWAWQDWGTRGEVSGFNDTRIRTAFHCDSKILSMLDLATDRALYWTYDAGNLPLFEIGSPLLAILHWWLLGRGIQLTHAAAVGTPAGGVLLAGKGGAGKSTTALACIGSGLLYAADDYCLLGNEPAPFAYSLYSTGKLAEDSLSKMPLLAAAVANPDRGPDDKALFYLHRHFPRQLASGFPVRAILLPQATDAPQLRLVPVSTLAVMKELMPSTIFQLPGAGLHDFQAIATRLKDVPCFRLELGAELSQIPAAIDDLLQTLPA